MRKRLTMSFDPIFAEEMRGKAQETGRTVSGLVRTAVKQYMKRGCGE